MIDIILLAVFAVVMIGLSLRANAALRHEARLPMQWSVSGKVNWSAPRAIALSLTPALAIVILSLAVLMPSLFHPRPGQEDMALPVLIAIGIGFVAIHALHLALIRRTLRREGR